MRNPLTKVRLALTWTVILACAVTGFVRATRTSARAREILGFMKDSKGEAWGEQVEFDLLIQAVSLFTLSGLVIGWVAHRNRRLRRRTPTEPDSIRFSASRHLEAFALYTVVLTLAKCGVLPELPG